MKLVSESLSEAISFQKHKDPKRSLGLGTVAIEEWLKDMNIRNYKINDDLSIDVHEYGIIIKNLEGNLPNFIQFGKIFVEGGGQVDFDISDNENLTTLKGCPKQIKGTFFCRDNKNLQSFEFLPQALAYNMYGTPLYSLKDIIYLSSGQIYGLIVMCGVDKLKLIEDALIKGIPLKKTSMFSILKLIRYMDQSYVEKYFSSSDILNKTFNPFNRKFLPLDTTIHPGDIQEIEKDYNEAIKIIEKSGFYNVTTGRQKKNGTIAISIKPNEKMVWGIFSHPAIREAGKTVSIIEHPFYNYSDYAKWLINYLRG